MDAFILAKMTFDKVLEAQEFVPTWSRFLGQTTKQQLNELNGVGFSKNRKKTRKNKIITILHP
ncbi:hypothetical protein QR98_0028220 [Sarcoptes scabiei]|uniref:Uncharacterized protein n=1 Tax=Sarcoptes scabiei TaxID=52283 RepID=A0A131ZZT8_SARSC|nr:hypothetical protein QR98_0028220 [Sarcoptes scabiei]